MAPEIKVKQGTVIGGTAVLPNGQPYNYFKGIPYAEPPLGKLRFKATIPLNKFRTESIYCVKEGNIPCQLDSSKRKMIGSEDCLFLNVFSPQTNNNDLMPVMVFIHGGAYFSGSGNSDFYNPLYLLQEGVVVVTFNYRLGVFGFLSYPEANIPGNAGIRDQRLALQWVHENISQFNGDPNNVTLFGVSAGSTCAQFHILSEESKKYVHKAILQSGVVTMNWAWRKSISEKTIYLAKLLGCTSDDPFEIVEFLQTFQDLQEFVKPFTPDWTIDYYIVGYPVPCMPCIETNSPDTVLSEQTLDSVNKENSVEIPLMMGYNSAEGILMLPCVQSNLEYYDKHLDTFIPNDIQPHLTEKDKTEVVDKMRDFYFYGQRLDTSNLQSFSKLLSDYFFVFAANKMAETHSKKQHKSPLYYYRFDVDESLNIYKKKLQMEKIKGACHGDDIFYIFQSQMCPEPWDRITREIVLKMCKMWTNFAKTGNPTPENDRAVNDCIWQPLRTSNCEQGNSNALIINRSLKMVENPDGERIEFWRKIKQQYVKT